MLKVLLTSPHGRPGIAQFIESAFRELGAEVRSFDVNDNRRPAGIYRMGQAASKAPIAGSKIGWRLERARRKDFLAEFEADLERALKEWRPDIWLAILCWNDPVRIEMLDRANSVHKIAWLMDDPFLRDGALAKVLPGFDRIYAVDGSWVIPARLVSGRPSSMLACGADVNVNYPVQYSGVPDRFRSEVSFVGTSYCGEPAGIVRAELLKRVQDLGLKIYGDQRWLQSSGPGNALAQCYQGGGELTGSDANLVYCGTKVALNIHHPQWREGTSLRTFAIAASGAFQLVDYRRGLDDFFVLDDEIVAYSSSEEFREKAIYYLDHPEERARIARASFERVVREHRYVNRIAEMLLAEGVRFSANAAAAV